MLSLFRSANSKVWWRATWRQRKKMTKDGCRQQERGIYIPRDRLCGVSMSLANKTLME